MDLRGKTVLVTGAAKGIGREAAAQLAQVGASVVATDLDQRVLTDVGSMTGIRGLQQDVTSVDDWKAVIADIAGREGRLDVLINNAGIILNRRFLETSLEDFRRVQQINVESIWIGMQAAAQLMIESAGSSPHGGSIVNLSSLYGIQAGPFHAAYGASKGAVRLLTKCTAVELAPMRIRVNSVHPGPCETDLGMSGLVEAVNVGRLPDLADAKNAVARNFPMGRWGQTDDIAGVILFLASDNSRFMTGAELTVDGGYSLL